MKKSLAVFLLTLAIFSLFILRASASDDFAYYIQDDGTIAISEYKGSEYNVVIPEAISGIPVTTVGNGASAIFKSDSNSYYYITLPTGITKIADKAFKNTNIPYITLPESVIQIGDEAFAGCYFLTSVEIPNSVTKIGQDAFNTGKKPYWIEAEGSILQPTYLAGPRGAYAEKYAKENNIPYIIYDDYSGSTMYVVSEGATHHNWPPCDNADSYNFHFSVPVGTSFVVIGELSDYYEVVDLSGQFLFFGFIEKAYLSHNPPDTGIEHAWKEATCTEPATCTKCGITDGTANGHSWKDANCTNPQTCSVCKLTQGEPTDHCFVPNGEHLLTCSACAFSLGRNFDNIQLDTVYIIENYAEVTFISCEVVNSYYQYRQGHAGSSEKESIPSYKNQPVASNGKYYKYITKASSGNSDYLVVLFNVKNKQEADVAFLAQMEASLKQGNYTLTQEKASFQQQDKKTIRNPLGDSEHIRISYYPGEEIALSPFETGMYMVKWSVKKSEIHANSPLSIELVVGDKKMTYHIHN